MPVFVGKFSLSSRMMARDAGPFGVKPRSSLVVLNRGKEYLDRIQVCMCLFACWLKGYMMVSVCVEFDICYVLQPRLTALH